MAGAIRRKDHYATENGLATSSDACGLSRSAPSSLARLDVEPDRLGGPAPPTLCHQLCLPHLLGTKHAGGMGYPAPSCDGCDRPGATGVDHLVSHIAYRR